MPLRGTWNSTQQKYKDLTTQRTERTRRQILLHVVSVERESGLSGANYQVLYKALCHKYVNRKDLAGLFCIRESSDESEQKKEESTPE